MSAKSLCVSAPSLLCLTAVNAAPVTYQFFADSAFDTSGMTGISGSFTYVASDFISANLTVPLANLSTCTVTATPSAVCGDMSFAPGAYGYDQVAFGIPTSPSSGVSILYYFSRGGFCGPRQLPHGRRRVWQRASRALVGQRRARTPICRHAAGRTWPHHCRDAATQTRARCGAQAVNPRLGLTSSLAPAARWL